MSSTTTFSPASPAASRPDVPAVVARVLAARAYLDGALLPILHGVQDALGHIPAAAVAPIAQALKLSRAEVHGVITYYRHFRAEPAGRCVVQVCRAESCRTMGAEQLLEHARASLGCNGAHGSSADRAYTVEPVYCLGLCASSPAVMVGTRLHARMTPARLDAVLARESQP